MVTEAVPVTNNVDAVGATVGMLLLLIVIVTIVRIDFLSLTSLILCELS